MTEDEILGAFNSLTNAIIVLADVCQTLDPGADLIEINANLGSVQMLIDKVVLEQVIEAPE